MNLDKVREALGEAQQAQKKVYADKPRDDGYVRNNTFTTLKQNGLPAGLFNFRLLPPVEGKNPGMHLVQRHGIMKAIATARDGSQYPVYDWVLGKVSNPEMTFLDSINAYWREFERKRNDQFLELPQYLQQAIVKLRGETYFEVPCLFRAEHAEEQFEIDGRTMSTWKITKSHKTQVIGKVFQITAKSIYGKKTDNFDEDGNPIYDGLLGLLDRKRNPETGESIDSLGNDGRWIELSVTRPKNGEKGWPEYKIEGVSDWKAGALAPELVDIYMNEENYPDIPRRSQFMNKDNAAVANMFKNSKLYAELTTKTDWFGI